MAEVVSSQVTTDNNGQLSFYMSGYTVTAKIKKADGTEYVGAVTLTPDPGGGFPTVTHSDGSEFTLELISYKLYSETDTGTTTDTETATYTLGGTVSDLTGTLVLTNGGVDKTITANGSYSFDAPINSGSSYTVTVKAQPINQTCTVTNGSGTISANVSNVDVSCVSSCAGETVTRNWGTFTDCNDGTVKLEVTAGTFGGNTYTAKTLYFAKCTHGQTYDSSGNTCSATGATQVQYCSADDNSCQAGGANDGILDGSGTSAAYTACNGLSLASKTWRVPTKDELKLLINCNTTTEMPNDESACSGATAPTINNLFPNTLSYFYWSSSGDSAFSSRAWYVYFVSGSTDSSGNFNALYVRCISGP